MLVAKCAVRKHRDPVPSCVLCVFLFFHVINQLSPFSIVKMSSFTSKTSYTLAKSMNQRRPALTNRTLPKSSECTSARWSNDAECGRSPSVVYHRIDR
ncbi:unnamed protein product [Caenorhabditis sp. 36 PRJEB53466]|nr:unnamed protein product [Caenorhabditis sp. 36 PRJEB53466]